MEFFPSIKHLWQTLWLLIRRHLHPAEIFLVPFFSLIVVVLFSAAATPTFSTISNFSIVEDASTLNNFDLDDYCTDADADSRTYSIVDDFSLGNMNIDTDNTIDITSSSTANKYISLDNTQTVLLLHGDGANNSTTIVDDGVRQKTITVNGNAKVSTTQSKFGGSSMYFDGTGDYLTIPDSEDFTLGTNDFTIEFWARFDNLTGNHHIINQYNTSGSVGAWAIITAGTDIDLYMSSNGTSWDIASDVNIGTVSTGSWYHVAVSRQDSAIRLFLNGVLNNTITSSSSIVNANSNVNISITPVTNNEWMNGYMDDLRMTKGTALYTANFTPSTAAFTDNTFTSRIMDAGSSVTWNSLTWESIFPSGKEFPNNGGIETAYEEGNADMNNNKLLLHFNESTASNATTLSDSSGQSHTATLTTNNGSTEKIRAGKFANSLYFDGNGDYIELAAHGDWDLGSTDWSTEFWINPNTDGSTVDKILSTRGASGNGWEIMWYQNKFGFEGYGTNNTGGAQLSSTTHPQNNWYHVAIVNNDAGNTTKLYVDGTEELSYGNGFTWTSGSHTLRIGLPGSFSEPLDGYMDEIAIYKGTALTANEVLNHYQRGGSNLRYQVRSCDDSACSGESFLGEGVTTATNDTSRDFDAGDEGNFTQENASSGTDFRNGLMEMHRASSDSTVKMLIQGNGDSGDGIYDMNLTSMTVGSSNTVNTTTKKFGSGSVRADGTTNSKILADTSSYFPSGLANQSWVLEMWLNPSSASAGNIGGFMGSNYLTDFGPMSIWHSNSNLLFGASNNGSSWNIAQTATIGSVSSGTWKHLAIVYDAVDNTLSTYLDGTRTLNYTNVTSFQNHTYLSFLRWDNGVIHGEWNGYVDDVRLSVDDAANHPRYTGASFTIPSAEFTNIAFPTSQAYYATTNNNSDLSFFDVAEVNSVTVTSDAPTNTSIKALVSFDGRNTWKYKSGGSWSTATNGLADLQTSGMTIADLQTALTNYDITTETGLDFAFDLATSDGTVTPNIDQLTINYDAISGREYTYFSEVNNSAVALPSIPMVNAVTNNRYFQYRVLMTAMNNSYLPQLASVSAVNSASTITDNENTAGEFGGGTHNDTAWTSDTSDTVIFSCTAGGEIVLSNVVTISLNLPSTPTISSPSNAAINVSMTPNLISSSYAGQGVHSSSDWQIYNTASPTLSNDNSSANLVWYKFDDSTNKTSIIVNTTNGVFQNALNGQTTLAASTNYYIRVRHTNGTGDSNWSSLSSFKVTNNGIFTSTQTGDWNVSATWGEACVSSCVEGTDYPGASSTATISSGHTVTTPSGVTGNFTTLTVAGTLAANESISGITLNISSGGALNLATAKTINATTINVTGNLGLTGNLGTVTNINILSGGVLTQNNTTQQVITGTLDVQSGGILTHGSNASTQVYEVDFSAGTITVVGTVIANGKGFSTGGTGAGGANSGSGGAYGGYGGGNSGGGANNETIYGNALSPTNMGSNGGTWQLASGGAGGGAIILNSSGTVTISGSVTVNGGNGGTTTGADGYAGGGGTGGVISINATGNMDLSSSTISANGGNGGNAAARWGGGGSGGRIKLSYGGTYTAGTTLSAYGGTGVNSADDGGAGSIYIKPSAENGTLIYDNNNLDGIGSELTALADYTISELKVMNASHLKIPSGARLISNQATFNNVGNSSTLTIAGTFDPGNTSFTIPANLTVILNSTGTILNLTTPTINGVFTMTDGGTENFGAITVGNGGSIIMNSYTSSDTAWGITSLTINNGGTLTHTANSTSLEHKIKLSATNVTVNNGGSINVDGKGFQGGQSNGVDGSGIGKGIGNPESSGGGAAYGGVGGSGSSGTNGGSAYGSKSVPVDLGSGGGSGNHVDADGGTGGGAIDITTSGTFTLGGTLSADGSAGSMGGGHAGGGGAGGSVYLTVGSFSGNGSISADGAAGGDAVLSDGGGGGGGRISVNGASFTGSYTVIGAIGYGNATDGEPGTFYPSADFSTSSVSASTASPNIGTSVTYTTTVTNSANVAAANTTFRVAVLNGTTYTSNSVKVDGASQTDAGDADGVSVSNSVITVNLGTLNASSSKEVAFNSVIASGNSHGDSLTLQPLLYADGTGYLRVSGSITIDGSLITNVQSGRMVRFVNNNSFDPSASKTTGVQNLNFQKSGNTIARFQMNLDATRDISAMTWDTDTDNRKAFLHGFETVVTDNSDDNSYTLYIPHNTDDSRATLRICPGVASLGAIVDGCSNEVEFSSGQTKTVSGISATCTINSSNWECSGLTGTGGEEVPSGVPAKPSVASPSTGAIDASINPTITSSAFIGSPGHTSSDWQISDNNTFSDNDCSDTNLVWCSLDDVNHLESVIITTSNGGFINANSGQAALTNNITYYARVRHTNSNGDSDWSSSVSFTTTSGNSSPSVTAPSSLSQSTNGNGYVTFSAQVFDANSDNTQLKVEYSEDGGTTWYDPYLVSVTPSSGSASLENSESYQIGTSNFIDTASGAVNLTIVWDSQNASNGNGALTGDQTDIKIRLTANDFNTAGPPQSTSNIEVDNGDPSGLADFVVSNTTSSIATLTWTAATTENNFDHYEIWYGTNASDVTNRSGTASEWDHSDDANLATRTTITTQITSLTASTTYYFKIWGIDDYGNEITLSSTYATLASGNTPATVTNVSVTGPTGGDGVFNISFIVDDADDNNSVQALLEYNVGNGFQKMTLSESTTSVSSTYGTVNVENDNAYSVGNANGYIVTSYGANRITVTWPSASEFGGTLFNTSSGQIRITLYDGTVASSASTTSAVVIDNVAPATFTTLNFSLDPNRILIVNWNAVDDGHFDHYEIWYGTSASDVANRTGSAIEFDVDNDPLLASASTTTLQLNGLTIQDGYIHSVGVWAIDDYGNETYIGPYSLKTTPYEVDGSGGFIVYGGGSNRDHLLETPQEFSEELEVDSEGDFEIGLDFDLESERDPEFDGIKNVQKDSIRNLIEGHWSEEYVRYLIRYCSVHDPDILDMFEQITTIDDFLTRAEAVRFSLCLFGIPVEQFDLTHRPFWDVPTDHDLAPWIEKGREVHLVEGYQTDLSFHPDAFISRAEMLTMLLRFTVKIPIDSRLGWLENFDLKESPFSDIPLFAYYVPYIFYSYQHQIVEGYRDGTFRPNREISFAEFSKIGILIHNLYTPASAKALFFSMSLNFLSTVMHLFGTVNEEHSAQVIDFVLNDPSVEIF